MARERMGHPPDGVEGCRRLHLGQAGLYVAMLVARNAGADVAPARGSGADDSDTTRTPIPAASQSTSSTSARSSIEDGDPRWLEIRGAASRLRR